MQLPFLSSPSDLEAFRFAPIQMVAPTPNAPEIFTPPLEVQLVRYAGHKEIKMIALRT